MSTPTPVTPAPLTGQGILQLLESDVLIAAGQPLLTFLANVQEANGNPVAIALYFQQLVGDLTGKLPVLEAQIAQQITAALQAKLQALLAQANAAQMAAEAVKNVAK